MKTRDKILKESIKLFAEQGFEGTSMTMISSLLGFTKPAIYAHFANKAALFEACLDTISQEQITYIKSTLENPSLKTIETKLHSIINDCILIQDNHAFLFYNRFYLLPPVELKEQIKYKLDQSTEKWSSMLMDAIHNAIVSGEIDKSLTKTEVLSSYMCILNGVGYEIGSKHNLDHIWKIFWRGIKAN
ncbi:TetR/AcrR family transcriptional regulator [Paenibacillus sp. NPDC057886]|uniref:TetR/AcrR family transcriptional regulator n=1 Tax=Paenibacillus sp. NPDC057886 TaxID=3346270 RepID=UPI003686A9CD